MWSMPNPLAQLGGPMFDSAAKEAARFFGYSPVWIPMSLRADLRQMHFEALEDRRRARQPALYDTLAAAGWGSGWVYLRFGDVPAGERSMKVGPVEGLEEGVSVFVGRMTSEGHCLLDLGNWFQCLFITMMNLSGRPVYLLWGRVVGRGVGGEPLLRDINWVQPLHPASLMATKTPSRIVEDWNAHRQGSRQELG